VNPSPNDSILVGTINSPHLPPLTVGHLEKPKLSLRYNLEHLSLSLPKIKALNPCSWEKIRAPLWVSHPIQARALHPLSRRPWLYLLLLGIWSPRWLCISQELPRIVVESQEVCIALLFVGIDSEELSWPWWQLGRIRVERDPAICELLNGDTSNLYG
jgi:hypothetical protein